MEEEEVPMYDDDRGRQRDLVLANNEFCYVQSQTNGSIRTHVGPTTVSISQQELLVVFNPKTKQFVKVEQDKAKQLFVTAPEGWYITLKNPTEDGQFPKLADSNNSPSSMRIGVKINIAGPISFALFPGQMAKVIQGHKLRSNQYLLVRVYDAEAVKGKNEGTKLSGSDEADKTRTQNKYVTGQLLIVKGTKVSFYMPPTGIEVVPNADGSYVREAVTLERLNYAILKNENGEKRYVHGPAVVFPEPTETFIVNEASNSPIFQAVELSPIKGIYVKVIAPYEENGIQYKLGDELFITGNEDGQKIYYPRPEHAPISYGDGAIHYAIAIPSEGEGRYVMDRMTGEITTVRGPSMLLLDPRTQVFVDRALSDSECRLLYPNNDMVLEYNRQLRSSEANGADTASVSRRGDSRRSADMVPTGIQRRTTFTKPRTITLNKSKFDGVVSVDVWTGYAINVVSKTGKRQVVVGPTTRLLDYDETVEALQLSTGKPKTTDKLETIAYLRVTNNKVSDIINAQTKDYVEVSIKVSYVVDFLPEHQGKWFSIENYVKFLCDRERTAIKKAVKARTIQELYAETTEIVTAAVLGTATVSSDTTDADSVTSTKNDALGFFPENGMCVKKVEVLSLDMDSEVRNMMDEYRRAMVSDSLELAKKQGHLDTQRQIAEAEKEEAELQASVEAKRLELESKQRQAEIAAKRRKKEAKAKARLALAQSEQSLYEVVDAIKRLQLAYDKDAHEQAVEQHNADVATEGKRQKNYATTVETVFGAIQPDLVAALDAETGAQTLIEVTKAMSPWAIAQGQAVPDTVNKLLRGTPLEGVLEALSAVVARTEVVQDDGYDDSAYYDDPYTNN